MPILGRAGCQPAVRGSLPRTDFEHNIRFAKEDIRRSGRMQQAGSLLSPDPGLSGAAMEQLRCRHEAALLRFDSASGHGGLRSDLSFRPDDFPRFFWINVSGLGQ